jgi:hypothetical protein
MFKKLLAITLVAVMSLSLMGAAAAKGHSDLPIKVLYNARQVVFPDALPKIENNRVLVPIRFVAETLGATVDYANKLVTIRQEGKVIELPIGSNVTKVNGQSITLDTKAVAEKGRTYVPLRFVSEALGQAVEWDNISRYVWIGSKDVPMQEEIGEKRTFNEFLPFYGEQLDLIDDYDLKKNSVYLLTDRSFPVHLVGDFTDTIIYRVWEDVHEGNPVFKVHYRGRHFGMYFLTDNPVPRYRTNIEAWRTQNPDGSFVGVFFLKEPWDEIGFGLKDWAEFDYSDIRYIGFTMGPHNMPIIQYKQ